MREGLYLFSTDAQGGGPNFVLEGGSYGMLVPLCNIDAFADAMLEEVRDLPPDPRPA
jgi:hypothetical protein